MAERKTRNVSLPPRQDDFIDGMVAAGRYRTASEVVRDGLRLLEDAEHRRLLEEWLYKGLDAEDEKRLPRELLERIRAQFQGLIDEALDDVQSGRLSDGHLAMGRLRELLEARRG